MSKTERETDFGLQLNAIIEKNIAPDDESEAISRKILVAWALELKSIIDERTGK